MKIENYKGFEIEYNEGYNEGFSIVGGDVTKQKLSELKRYIDGIKRKEFERFKATKIDYSERIEEVEVTSHDGGDYVWIKDSKGRREKENTENLIKINKENENKLSEIEKVREEIGKLREKKTKLIKSLERLNVKDFVKSQQNEHGK